MKPVAALLLSALVLAAVLIAGAARELAASTPSSKGGDAVGYGGYPGVPGAGTPGFGPGYIPGFGPGSVPGFNPGSGNGWSGGYGGGYGGPGGSRSFSGVTKSSTVCKNKGPCYMKKLACPAKCFKSWSSSGKNYGGGGGGGGCTIDCNKCVAYC